MNMGSHAANPLNYSASGLPMMGVNGVPPHMSALYQSMSTNSAMNMTQDSDYWNSKIGSLSSGATDASAMSGNPSNGDQKMVSLIVIRICCECPLKHRFPLSLS